MKSGGLVQSREKVKIFKIRGVHAAFITLYIDDCQQRGNVLVMKQNVGADTRSSINGKVRNKAKVL